MGVCIAVSVSPAQGQAQAQDAPDTSSCDAVYREAAGFSYNWSMLPSIWRGETQQTPDVFRRLLQATRRARSCPDAASITPRQTEMYAAEAFALAALQRFPEARATFEAVQHALQERMAQPDAPSALHNWHPHLLQTEGYLDFLVGDLRRSVANYAEALNHLLASLPMMPDGDRRYQRLLWAVGSTLDLGAMYAKVRDLEAAEQRAQQALALLQETSQTTPQERQLKIRALSLRADLIAMRMYATHGRPDSSALREGLRLVDQSLALQATSASNRTARDLSLKSDLHSQLGEHKKAFAFGDEALQVAQVLDDSVLEALLLLKQGVVYVNAGRLDAAESVLQEGLSLATSLRRLDYQRRVLHQLGRLHEQAGRMRKAEAFYRDAMVVAETYRASLRATDWASRAFSAWQASHRGLVRTLLAQGRSREAFAVLERTRARHLSDMNAQARLSRQLPPAQRVTFDSLTQALASVRNRLSDAPLATDSVAFWRAEEAQLMSERRALVDLDSTATAVPLDTLQAHLRTQNRVLVSYFLHDTRGASAPAVRSHAFVVTADTLHTVPLPKATQGNIQALVEDVSPLFTSSGKSSSLNAVHFDLRALHALYRVVYQPLAERLPPDAPLSIVPDGPLFHIPMAALVRTPPSGRFAHDTADFLLHERPTSVLLAARLLPEAASDGWRLAPTGPRVAAFGVSSFERIRIPFSVLQSPVRLNADAPDAPVSRDLDLAVPELPGVRDELATLRALFSDARVALDEAATESALRRASSATVLHLASHAFVNEGTPLYSAFVLYPDSTSQSDRNDGILFLHELRSALRDVSLVVLSGCSTARGAFRSGEGMEGMQYAFRAMGARATVSTLWPAEDKAAVTLVAAFYRHLRRGVPKDVALRNAQLDYLEAHPAKSSPFFWGSSVLYGSPHPIAAPSVLLQAREWWGPSGWMAAVVLLTLGVWLAWRGRPVALSLRAARRHMPLLKR